MRADRLGAGQVHRGGHAGLGRGRSQQIGPLPGLARPAQATQQALAGALTAIRAQHLDDGLADAVQVGTMRRDDLRGDALAFPDQAEQDVLGADVVVVQLQRFAQGQFQGLLGSRGERDVPGHRRAAGADQADNLLTHPLL